MRARLTEREGGVYGAAQMVTSGPTEPANRPIPCLAIVNRGRTEIFRTLKADLEEPDVVEVIWDRRVADRRREPAGHEPDRRRGEGRAPRTPGAASR